MRRTVETLAYDKLSSSCFILNFVILHDILYKINLVTRKLQWMQHLFSKSLYCLSLTCIAPWLWIGYMNQQCFLLKNMLEDMEYHDIIDDFALEIATKYILNNNLIAILFLWLYNALEKEKMNWMTKLLVGGRYFLVER